MNNRKYFWSVFAEPPEILPFNFGKDILDEGDFAHVSCIVTKGDIPITISWTLQQGDTNSVSDSTITTSQAGPRASFLSISSVSHRHSGVYTCTATNKAGTSSFSTDLKVNGTKKTIFSNNPVPSCDLFLLFLFLLLYKIWMCRVIHQWNIFWNGPFITQVLRLILLQVL